ncbi:MAG: hypothetical protein WBE38_13995 [Terracidiphilus sp.]|jgi:hypothetical protein
MRDRLVGSNVPASHQLGWNERVSRDWECTARANHKHKEVIRHLIENKQDIYIATVVAAQVYMKICRTTPRSSNFGIKL